MPLMSVRERRRVKLSPDEILFLRGKNGELGLVKTGVPVKIFMATPHKEEVILFLQEEDLIAVSAFDNGDKIEKGIRSLIFLLKEMGSPLVVLPENHPTSQRLPLVVSCGERIRLDCNITPGTHPEQDILCACEEFSGLEITATEDGVLITGELKGFKVEKL